MIGNLIIGFLIITLAQRSLPERCNKLRDIMSFLIVLACFLIKNQDVFTVLTIALFALVLLVAIIDFLLQPKLCKTEIDELSRQNGTLTFLTTKLQLEIDSMKEHMKELEDFKNNQHLQMLQALHCLYQLEINKFSKEEYQQIIDLLEECKSLYSSIEFNEPGLRKVFSDLTTLRELKKARRNLRSIISDNDLGEEFNKMLHTYLDYLEVRIENANTRIYNSRRKFR